jgi:murein DD-endopeptidase MepM/ murein hydrolase activator NlpD
MMSAATIASLLVPMPLAAATDTATAESAKSEETGPSRTARGPKYVFPFSKVDVSWPADHLHYPAVDVEGCYARVLAPVAGVITQVRRKDKWDPAIDSPGTRGGLTIIMHGDDTVRYFFSHLGRIKVKTGQRVEAGHWIGVIGSSGNARVTRCHLHLGLSRICPLAETRLLQGELWPQRYLEAWRQGEQLSPRREKNALIAQSPNGCTAAADDLIQEVAQRTERRKNSR